MLWMIIALSLFFEGFCFALDNKQKRHFIAKRAQRRVVRDLKREAIVKKMRQQSPHYHGPLQRLQRQIITF